MLLFNLLNLIRAKIGKLEREGRRCSDWTKKDEGSPSTLGS